MVNDWAIVVGIRPYGYPDMDTLEGPEEDAKAFYEWLIKKKGGNIDDLSRIKIFTPRKFGTPESPRLARPHFNDINSCVEEIIDSLDEQKEHGRRLYVYMSGHGCTPIQAGATENVALFMANARLPDRAIHNFPGTSCARFIQYTGYFKEVILIMDCCRFKEFNASSPVSFILQENTTRSGRLVQAYATGWDTGATECPVPPDNMKRGIFTHELLEVLNSGRITAAQLRESVKEHMKRFFKTNLQLKPQEPEILGEPDGLVDIIFSENADPPRSLVTIKHQTGMPLPEVTYVDECEWPPKLVERKLGDPTDPWQWLLTPGKYGIKIGNKYAIPFTVFAALPEEVEVIL